MIGTSIAILYLSKMRLEVTIIIGYTYSVKGRFYNEKNNRDWL